MNILHYTLGLPPQRSGGLVIYAMELIMAQKRGNNNVFLLQPGGYSIFRKKKKIIASEPFNGIASFKIKNPVTIPLLHGVKEPLKLTGDKNRLSFSEMETFYNKIKPEIFHIHTLMGLPYELVLFLKKKKVRIIFITQDYYGICLKVNLIDWKNQICDTHTFEKCAQCNHFALSSYLLRIRNSNFVLAHKKQFVKFAKKTSTFNKTTNVAIMPPQKVLEYKNLLCYYKKFYTLIDCFHYNSTLAKEIYNKYLHLNTYNFIYPITHSNIKDSRVARQFNINHIRFGFIGNLTAYKGFPLLKEILLSLQKAGITNWTLDVWGNHEGKDKDSDKIHYRGKYTDEQRSQVFEEMDLLILPAMWYETFGLIILEALSHGVPALVSSTVGAKDIVSIYDKSFIFATQDEFKNKLKSILSDISLLENYNKKICELEWNYDYDSHVEKIMQIYRSLIDKE